MRSQYALSILVTSVITKPSVHIVASSRIAHRGTPRHVAARAIQCLLDTFYWSSLVSEIIAAAVLFFPAFGQSGLFVSSASVVSAVDRECMVASLTILCVADANVDRMRTDPDPELAKISRELYRFTSESLATELQWSKCTSGRPWSRKVICSLGMLLLLMLMLMLNFRGTVPMVKNAQGPYQ
ncbi:hypothetical protein CC78DRAFT_617631 [Lojkania enalia]|uniref:Uncharacterized protein n=1 Tax=Lojkania enalia TaxID=147567 RepID=A0A9P4K789_9PLEO|nr:hypothetical protein CC78DRAFT_617631 [Didymosphaeria enalia]